MFKKGIIHHVLFHFELALRSWSSILRFYVSFFPAPSSLCLFMSQNGANDVIVSLPALHLMDSQQIVRSSNQLVSTNQPSQEGSSFGDSSGPFFSMYSKAAEKVDVKTVKCWQNKWSLFESRVGFDHLIFIVHDLEYCIWASSLLPLLNSINCFP